MPFAINLFVLPFPSCVRSQGPQNLQHCLLEWMSLHSLTRYNLCCKLILTEYCQLAVLFAIELSLHGKKRSQPDGTDQ
jgi:hypothetical protein